MTDVPMRALMFVHACNASTSLAASLESLIWQTHPAMHVLFVDDGSEDGSGELARRTLEQFFDGRHTYVRNEQSWGLARNAHAHLRAALGNGDFVVLLDAADELLKATIVAELASEHAAGFDIVWTDRDAAVHGTGASMDPFRSAREQPWGCTGLFSFRAELLRAVSAEYLQDTRGDWLTVASDRVLGYPLLDQTRRWRHMPVRACRRSGGDIARGEAEVRATEIARTKPALPCKRWLLADHGAADHALALARATTFSAAVPAPLPLAHAAKPSVAHDPWLQVAASALSSRCPALLSLALDGQGELPDAGLLWRWWQWLQCAGPAPRVLEIGTGELAPMLHALVAGLGGHVTSVCTQRNEAMSLFARLSAAGLEPEVLHAPLIDGSFGSVQARFPDLTTLPTEASGYNTAIVGGACSPDGTRAATLALPMLAPRLAAGGFRVCLWSPDDPASLRDAQEAWAGVAPELQYSAQAMGGTSLVVHAA